MKTNPNDPAMEAWVPVKGYEGQYEVSSLGRLRSLDRYMNNKAGNQSLKKGRILKGKSINSGSVMISLTVDRKVRELLLHRIVAEHFLPDFDPNLQVMHKDRDRSNNAASNLIMGGALAIMNSLETPRQTGFDRPVLTIREYFAAIAMQAFLPTRNEMMNWDEIDAAIYAATVAADKLISKLNETSASDNV